MKLRLVGYILKKIVAAVLTLFALSVLIFYTTTFFSPVQRVALYLPDNPYGHSNAPDPIPGLIKKYGLNDPFPVQYARWLNEVLHGNLGYSQRFRKPVVNVLRSSFAATLELVLYSAPIAIFGGYWLGLFLAKRASSKAPREDPVDFAGRSATIIGYSIPSFCLGLILLEIAWLGFKQFPVGRLSVSANDYVNTHSSFISYTGLYTIDSLLNGQYWIFLDAVGHLILPVIALATEKLAIVVRITRSSTIRESFKPYIVTAKAKGLDEKAVFRHAKRNSLISVFTISGVLLASMLTGVIVIESLFVFNGIGFVIVEAASSLDYTLLVSLALSFCVIFMFINLIVDIAYAYIDPRVKA